MSNWNQSARGFNGRIENFPLTSILQILELGQQSGSLFLYQFPRVAALIFWKGKVIQAVSSLKRESLGEMLISKQLLNNKTLERALELQSEAPRHIPLGKVLVDNNMVSRATIIAGLTEQVQNIVTELIKWTTGDFSFYGKSAHVEVDTEDYTEIIPDGIVVGRLLHTLILEDERRLTPRLSLKLKVKFKWEGKEYLGFSKDISQTGIFVETPQLPNINDQIQMAIWVPAFEHPRGAIGQVVRVDKSKDASGFAAQFISIDPQVVDAVAKLSTGEDILEL